MRVLTAFVLALLLSPAAAVAQEVDAARDWWQWGGPGRDFLYDAADLVDAWPAEGPPVIWSRSLGAGHSAIIAAGGEMRGHDLRHSTAIDRNSAFLTALPSRFDSLPSLRRIRASSSVKSLRRTLQGTWRPALRHS